MKAIFITILVALSFSVVSIAQEPVPLHEPDGKCHRSYKNPNDCRHPCDHAFCKCMKDKGEDCCAKNARCSNKCCEDGKIEC